MHGEISGTELKTALGDGRDPLIVDIRPPAAFEREHIPGSVNIPFASLPQDVDQVAGSDHVVTVCPHGKASVQAATLIASFEDFDGRVESLDCGLSGWDGPLEHSNDSETEPTGSVDAPF